VRWKLKNLSQGAATKVLDRYTRARGALAKALLARAGLHRDGAG